MINIYIRAIFTAIASYAVIATPLQVVSEADLLLPQLPNVAQSVYTPNSSTNLTANGPLTVTCHSDGDVLNLNDCRTAMSSRYMGDFMLTNQWAERRPELTWEYNPLPRRFMSDEAKCYIQPVLEYPRAITGRATLDSIKNAATSVLERCTVGGRTQGGIAKNIGLGMADYNVDVVVGSYNSPSPIQCDEQAFSGYDACMTLMLRMPAPSTQQIFGVDVVLPKKISIKPTVDAPWKYPQRQAHV